MYACVYIPTLRSVLTGCVWLFVPTSLGIGLLGDLTVWLVITFSLFGNKRGLAEFCFPWTYLRDGSVQLVESPIYRVGSETSMEYCGNVWALRIVGLFVCFGPCGPLLRRLVFLCWTLVFCGCFCVKWPNLLVRICVWVLDPDLCLPVGKTWGFVNTELCKLLARHVGCFCLTSRVFLPWEFDLI